MQINQHIKPSYYTKFAVFGYGQSVNINHDLGNKNVKITAYAVCKIAEFGYTLGQKAQFLGHYAQYSINPFAVIDANNILITTCFASNFVILNRIDGMITEINTANWDIEIFVEVL